MCFRTESSLFINEQAVTSQSRSYTGYEGSSVFDWASVDWGEQSMWHIIKVSMKKKPLRAELKLS